MIFLGNACVACLMARPTVDGMAKQMAVPLVRVDVATEMGRALRSGYAIRGTPTFQCGMARTQDDMPGRPHG